MGLLARLGHLLLGRPAGSTAAAFRLRALAQQHGAVELRPARARPGEGDAVRLAVLSASRGEFTVDGSNPAARGISRFGRFEVALAGDGPTQVGEVECLGRVRVAQPGGRMRPAYRFSIPDRLRDEVTSPEVRPAGGAGLAEAQLRVLGRQGPIQAVVEDITARGASVRCRNGHGSVQEGGHAHFRTELPPPIGTIDDVVRVLAVESDPGSGEMVLRVQFGRKIEALAHGASARPCASA